MIVQRVASLTLTQTLEGQITNLNLLQGTFK